LVSPLQWPPSLQFPSNPQRLSTAAGSTAVDSMEVDSMVGSMVVAGGHHGPWGFGHRWDWAGYGGGYYGGCILKRYYDEDGEVTVSKVCY
jgi:hypothetical protein